MPSNRRRNGPLEVGVILLFYEIMDMGVNNVPPITLFTIIGQALLYLGYIDVPWSKNSICISAYNVLKNKDWKRFILSTFEHGDDMHLYYNMASFLLKGRTLEKKYGSKNFGFLLMILVVLTNLLYIIIGQSMTEFTNDPSYVTSCAIGFSGVIFALKVLTTWESPGEKAQIYGITMPGKYAAWVELILIHMLVPNSSFIGHLAGILAGVLYCKTFVGRLIDYIITSFTGNRIQHAEFVDNSNFAGNYSYGNFNDDDDDDDDQGLRDNVGNGSYWTFDQRQRSSFRRTAPNYEPRNYGWRINGFGSSF